MSRLLKSTHCLVFPTRYAVEAQPIVLIEATVSGCAIVTTWAGEIPWTVGDGAVFVESNAQSVADGILRLFHDREECHRLARTGLRQFHDRFSFERHAARLREVWLSKIANYACG